MAGISFSFFPPLHLVESHHFKVFFHFLLKNLLKSFYRVLVANFPMVAFGIMLSFASIAPIVSYFIK